MRPQTIRLTCLPSLSRTPKTIFQMKTCSPVSLKSSRHSGRERATKVQILLVGNELHSRNKFRLSITPRPLWWPASGSFARMMCGCRVAILLP
jgi:hypothetical protein